MHEQTNPEPDIEEPLVEEPASPPELTHFRLLREILYLIQYRRQVRPMLEERSSRKIWRWLLFSLTMVPWISDSGYAFHYYHDPISIFAIMSMILFLGLLFSVFAVGIITPKFALIKFSFIRECHGDLHLESYIPHFCLLLLSLFVIYPAISIFRPEILPSRAGGPSGPIVVLLLGTPALLWSFYRLWKTRFSPDTLTLSNEGIHKSVLVQESIGYDNIRELQVGGRGQAHALRIIPKNLPEGGFKGRSGNVPYMDILSHAQVSPHLVAQEIRIRAIQSGISGEFPFIQRD